MITELQCKCAAPAIIGNINAGAPDDGSNEIEYSQENNYGHFCSKTIKIYLCVPSSSV